MQYIYSRWVVYPIMILGLVSGFVYCIGILKLKPNLPLALGISIPATIITAELIIMFIRRKFKKK
jgi:hypothetical protein